MQPGRRALAVALVFAGIALGAGLARWFGLLGAPPDPSAKSLDEARRLRAGAETSCDRHLWRECLHSLDVAKDLDPPGEQDERVVELRAMASAAARD